ncbi:MAG: hypothetical protein JXR96_23670 [Deltaproteobacteria bacterium]|nr:hypothetical protein [Deltaproteobacteria bacterium]
MLAAIALSSCGAPWERVKDSEDVDELRRFIQEHPRDPSTVEARNRVALLEYRAAVASGSRYAFNIFLERYPDSPYSLRIKRRVDELDFEQAVKAGSSHSLGLYLRQHPRGRHVVEVQRRLDEQNCAAMSRQDDPRRIRSFLSAHPETGCKAELEQRIKRLHFERVRQSGDVAEAWDFIRAHPGDPLVREVEQLLLGRQVAALRDGARFEQAESLIRERAPAGELASMIDSVRSAQQAWQRAGFEPVGTESKPVRDLYARLARATRTLRATVSDVPASAELPGDPRERWLLADKLMLAPDEQSADLLLLLCGDAFVEVRHRAHRALDRVIDSIGPVRAGNWLGEKRARLAGTARADVLLLRLALVLELAGDAAMALHQIERLLTEAEVPDVFAMFLAFELRRKLAQQREAASMARRFSEAAVGFADRRIEAWESLKDSQQGWLTFRQLFGLLSLWQALLDVFQREELSACKDSLGDWLELSRKNHRRVRRWFEDEELRWSLNHEGYARCAEPERGRAQAGAAERERISALVLLALTASERAAPTLRWTVCCHASQDLRAIAASLGVMIDTLRALEPMPHLAAL